MPRAHPSSHRSPHSHARQESIRDVVVGRVPKAVEQRRILSCFVLGLRGLGFGRDPSASRQGDSDSALGRATKTYFLNNANQAAQYRFSEK